MADKALFYKTDANTTIKCKDGEMKINKRMLPKTLKFEANPDTGIINMPDYDVLTIQAFLDTLMGFEELDKEKALLIFPIVMRYDIYDLVQKCISNLKPTVMNENVIHTLNVAFCFCCEELIDIIITFLVSYGVNHLFLEPNYYLLLEPKSLAALLRTTVSKNVFILKGVVNWGKNYIETKNLDIDLRTFLKKHYILNKLPINCLEPAGSVFEFYDANDDNMNVFTERDILNYLRSVMVEDGQRYEWSNVGKNQTVKEVFSFKNCIYVQSLIKLQIQFNATVCSSDPNYGKNNCCFEITVTSTYKDKEHLNEMYCKRETNSSYKIFPSECTGSAKGEISVTLCTPPNEKNYDLLSNITITYKFYKDCKILKTPGNWVPFIFTDYNWRKNYSFFTCGIELS